MTLALPHHDRVVADIVLIAWQRVDTLRSCLESLLAMTDAPPFGVRISSNGATDEVKAFLREEVSGATIAELEENIGFGAGCNAAAAGSRAEHLVFLNDDTVVDPGWLKALVSAADPDTAVGSVLLNSDGTLQEAGARIFSTGWSQVLGSGLELDEAEEQGLLTAREVDYASGAALLIPRARFEQLGGFDPAYRPAYWEDADLCFRLRAAGVRVVLEPSAFVTHTAFGSVEGNPLFREFALERAHALFAQRWADVLPTAAEQGDPPEVIASVTGSSARMESRYPTVTHEEADVLRMALDISRDFGEWLKSRAAQDAEESERLRAQLQAAERRADAAERQLPRLDQLELRVLSQHRQIEALESRLAELDSMGVVSAVRWGLRRRG